MKKKQVCIHGHFYQPPRENPWLEEVEQQDSAGHFHDWNERITYECYEPNTASRILDEGNHVVKIVNNYENISFNFGPTLLSWLEGVAPTVYEAIREADRKSREKYSGHGSALAQAYNHMIMPLANDADKKTQVIWGIKDFESRFERRPEGMWLPETAVDTETLEIMAGEGIRFTILAPGQARQYRKPGEEEWIDAGEHGIDPRRPYLCKLPSGKSIALFFYEGAVSHDIAFNGLLKNGREFAVRLQKIFDEDPDGPQLAHLATDGETYGHHHRHADMALAFCNHFIENDPDTELTNYGKFLEENPPGWEVQIHEDTSWSCAHGVERWRSNCGCRTSPESGLLQHWREPLRNALDLIRDRMIRIYEEHAGVLLRDPWEARNDYISIILERSEENLKEFLEQHARKTLSRDENVKVRKLLEMQRHAMLMYTSCGWFFDDISGIETVQILRYAARAIQLAHETSGSDLEADFLNVLKDAVSNYPKQKNGAHIYRKYVKTNIITLPRVAAHYAISGVFKEQEERIFSHAYQAASRNRQRAQAGSKILTAGHSQIHSQITGEVLDINYAVYYLGDHHVVCGIRKSEHNNNLVGVFEDMKGPFERGDITALIKLIDQHFGRQNYTLFHLFRDEQINILQSILQTKLEGIRETYRQVFNDNYGLMKTILEMGIHPPDALFIPGEYTLQNDLRELAWSETLEVEEIERIMAEMDDFGFSPDSRTIFGLTRKIITMMEGLKDDPWDLNALRDINMIFDLMGGMEIDIDLWELQNQYYLIMEKNYGNLCESFGENKVRSGKVLKHLKKMGDFLNVKFD